MRMNIRSRSLPFVSLVAFAFVLFAVATNLNAASGKGTSSRSSKVRADLHHNLDGKGDGFIVRWSYTRAQFILVIDTTKYSETKVLAATMTARSIFDSNGVALPRVLVVRDANGTELARGLFSNVPALIQ